MKNIKNVAIVILAAGASRRLGQAKQLVNYQGEPLLKHMIRLCLEADLGNVFVILGARAKQIRETICDLNEVQILENENWEQGMSNTIAFAAKEILLKVDYQGVCFVLSDQIHFSAELLGKLINGNSGKKIVISKYKNGQGPPSYFDQSLFIELAELDGDDGAKAVVRKNKLDVGFIDFPLGEVDIDTTEDLQRIKNME